MIAGSAVANYPPAQQPTTDKIVLDQKEAPHAVLQDDYSEVIKSIKQEIKKAPPSELVTDEQGDTFVITAYDLSVSSCGKPIGHPNYGKTATGYSLAGQSWHSARTISVDPRVIPLGSKVQIKFLDPRHHKYNGVYTARDTGGGVNGYHVDLFIGDFGEDDSSSEIAYAFGKTKAEIVILE